MSVHVGWEIFTIRSFHNFRASAKDHANTHLVVIVAQEAAGRPPSLACHFECRSDISQKDCKKMGQVLGVGADGVQAGGLFAQAQTAAMTGNSIVAVFVPVLVAIATAASTASLLLSGHLLK